jgi:hypothetical protein
LLIFISPVLCRQYTALAAGYIELTGQRSAQKKPRDRLVRGYLVTFRVTRLWIRTTVSPMKAAAEAAERGYAGLRVLKLNLR